MTPNQLNELSRTRVDADESKRIWGEEARALVLARLAWEKAEGLAAKERASLGDTLAWAWFANGKDADAIAQSEASLALASDDERSNYAGYLASLKTKVVAASGEAGGSAMAALRDEVAQLTALVDTRRTYRFAEESQRFLHDTLGELQRKLATLESNERRSVQERLSWAERIESLTRGHPKARVTWQAAREALEKADGVVASTLYQAHSIHLQPQMGLVPIGMNPQTKLWEFYDLRSAWDGKGDPAAIEIPQHVTDGERAGHIGVGDDTGIVFVLLPGGMFTMGAQKEDPQGPNYEPEARDNEKPRPVTLVPFFLARHELTQGQWRRLSGGQTPSYNQAASKIGGQRIGWSNPVEQVDWYDCERWLGRHGMALPTEAQWEYGCRGGTTTPWWTGGERDTLRGAANLADQTAKKGGASWPDIADWPDLEDGFVVHGPVDTLRANAFGLHHVHGNVWEWCSDFYGSSSARSNRGGGFNNSARGARSASRDWNAPTIRDDTLGARPARALQP